MDYSINSKDFYLKESFPEEKEISVAFWNFFVGISKQKGVI